MLKNIAIELLLSFMPDYIEKNSHACRVDHETLTQHLFYVFIVNL
jgi:hypothetical protein